MSNARVGITGTHNELTVVYDKATGEIVHVHLFASHDGSSLSPEEKDQLARETAMHRYTRKKAPSTPPAMATLHVAGDALVRGKAYHVDLKAGAIAERMPKAR